MCLREGLGERIGRDCSKQGRHLDGKILKWGKKLGRFLELQVGQCGWNRVLLGRIAQKGGEVVWGRAAVGKLISLPTTALEG